MSSSLSPIKCFSIPKWTCDGELGPISYIGPFSRGHAFFTLHSTRGPWHNSLCRRDESYLHHSRIPRKIRGRPNHCLYSYPVTDNVWQRQSLRLIHAGIAVTSSRRTAIHSYHGNRLWHRPWSVPIAGLRYKRYHNLVPECLTDIQYPWPWDAVIQSTHSIASDALSLSLSPW